MKEELIETIDETLALILSVADEYTEEIADQLEDVGNPEKLIGKPFESWTPEDLNMLSQVYGTEEPNVLSNLIFNKKYDEVKSLEEEEI